ncbi:MAG: NAD-dependent epimerase/dehydratase family protein [Myxococcota bacterium]
MSSKRDAIETFGPEAESHRREKIVGRRARVVALTGADSLIGRNLIALLEEDHFVERVVALDISLPEGAGLPKGLGSKSRFYKVDLTRPGVGARLVEIFQTESVETVVHLAFLSNPVHALAWSHELESAGTMHVLNACGDHGIAHFILASQTMLYGPLPQNPNFLTEEHPLRGIRGSSCLTDKIQAEHETSRFSEAYPQTLVTVLRLAPIIGPTVSNLVTKWLSRRLVPTVLGFDPLIQLLHEMDAIAAFKHALDHPTEGVFNVVGEGVLPLSKVIKLAGRFMLPVPESVLHTATRLLWSLRVADAPAEFVRYLRYLCVADGQRCMEELGLVPAFSTREAVLDFVGALRMREARLLGR